MSTQRALSELLRDGTVKGLPLHHHGKVRETYVVPDHPKLLLMVASDRLSTHNVVHKTHVPGKGELLTALSVFWTLEVLKDVPHHVVAYGKRIYDFLPRDEYASGLHYRALLIRQLAMLRVEFVWRKYLAGSLFAAYEQGKDPYGLGLPPGLPKMWEFSESALTPTRKSKGDEPLRAAVIRRQFLEAAALTAKVFRRIAYHLEPLGVAEIDGKFEVGWDAERREWVLADEFGTGDSSRFTWRSRIELGRDPPWLDKEVFREAAARQWGSGPRVSLTFSDDVVEEGLAVYHEAFETITGLTLREFQRMYFD